MAHASRTVWDQVFNICKPQEQGGEDLWPSEAGSTSEASSNELLFAVPGSAKKESAVSLGLYMATDCRAAAL